MYLNVHKNAQEELGQEPWFQTLTEVTESVGGVLASWLVAKIGGEYFNLSKVGQQTLGTTFLQQKFMDNHIQKPFKMVLVYKMHIYML